MNPRVMAGLGVLVAILLVGAGYMAGRNDSVVEVKQNPLVIATCTEPVPPTDKTFGATTFALIAQVGQYRACKTACLTGGH